MVRNLAGVWLLSLPAEHRVRGNPGALLVPAGGEGGREKIR